MNKKIKKCVVLTLSAFACAGIITGVLNAVNVAQPKISYAAVGDTVHIGNNDYTSIYETGFESCPTASQYKETKNYTVKQGDGLSWTVYYGCSSTSEKLSGTRSVQMRLYKDKERGYAQTTKSIESVKALSFKYKVSDSSTMKFDVDYSIDDGDTWTTIETVTAPDTKINTYSHEFTTKNDSFRFRVKVSDDATAPELSGNVQLTIDDVIFGKEITNDVITSVSVSSTKEGYKYGEIINKVDFNAVVTKNGGEGSIDDLTAQVGKVVEDTFVVRSDVTFGKTTIDLSDTAILFTAKYPTTPQGSEYLTSRVDFSTTYADLTTFSATESLEISERKTGTIEVSVNEFADPRATFVSSDEEVATVDPNTGVVTGVSSGTCTITSTSVGKTSSGESMSASTSITVLFAPIFENNFRLTGFTSKNVDNGYEETKDFGENSFFTFSSTTNSKGKIGGIDATNGQQFGTSDYPFSSFKFITGHQGAYKIEKVVLLFYGASPSSEADISVIGGTKELECEEASKTIVHYKGTAETTLTFIPSEEPGFGDVKITFDNVIKGFYIKNIAVFATLVKDTNEAKANAFAKRVELADTCGEQSQLIADYDALSDEVRNIVDSIIIHDWNGSSSKKGARTLELTVLNKMDAIKARQAEHDGSSRVGGINNPTLITTVTTIASILAIGFVSFFIMKKKKKTSK